MAVCRHYVGVRCILVLAVAGALLVPANATTASESGLWGFVRRGPITPVCVQGRPCSAPAANVTIVFARGGREAARVTTRRDGSYRVALTPGVYRARTLAKLVIGRGLTPARVTVVSGRRARVDFALDTGIR